MNEFRMTRREAMAALAAGVAVAPALDAWAVEPEGRFGISACDWSMRHRGDVGVLETAKEMGLDGVQITFGPPGEGDDLRDPKVREQYLSLSKKTGIKIGSLGMGCLNQVPYATEASAEKWVSQCIDVMPKLGVKVVLLAFFSEGDINGRPDLQREVVKRLKRVAPKAEKAGVILGIESYLSGRDHLRILDAVGSPAVQVYYDMANSLTQGYDVYQELRDIGKDRICEIHCKERTSLLGKGDVDFPRVRRALDDIGWGGWLVIEGAMDKQLGHIESYKLNQAYLRSVFM